MWELWEWYVANVGAAGEECKVGKCGSSVGETSRLWPRGECEAACVGCGAAYIVESVW